MAAKWRVLAAVGAAVLAAVVLWWTARAPGPGPGTPPEPVPAAESAPPTGEAPGRPRARARQTPADADAEATDAVRGADDATPPATLFVRVTRAAGGEPIPGARVEATVGDAPAATATTDPDGRARLALPAAGDAAIVARAPGHVRAERKVSISAGEEHAVPIELARGVTVAGRVVRAEDGAPIAGATVEATEGGALGGAARMTAAGPLGGAVSQTDGSFRIDGVPPGEMVTLRGAAEGRAEATVTVVPGDETAAASGSGAGTAPSAAGAPDPALVELRLEAAGTVRGVVRDRAGHAVAGAQVFLVPADAPSLLVNPEGTLMSSSLGRRAARRATSGADGAFVVDGVPFGAAHFALAQAEGHATSEPVAGVVVGTGNPSTAVDLVVRRPAAFEIAVLTTDGAPVAGAEVAVRRRARPVALVETDAAGIARAEGLDVASFILTARKAGHPSVTRAHAAREGETLRVEIRLPQGVAIEGIVVDDTGRPLPGARVKAHRPTWERAFEGLPESEGTAVADAQGRFRIEGLVPGAHELQAQEEGRPLTGEAGPVEAPSTGARLVSLRRATLRFRLVPPEGAAPLDQLHVHLGSLVHRPKWHAGSIEIAELEPGAATAAFRIAGYVAIDRAVTLAPGDTTDLGDIALDPGAEVRGRVVDRAGAGVAGASLRWGDVFTPTAQNATTDTTGAFVLRHLAAGANDVRVEAEGFLSRTADVQVGPGAGDARIVLDRGGLVEGTVRGPAGEPLADVFVHIVDAAAKAAGEEMDDREAWERTDARGAFSARLLPGRYAVHVEWKVVGRKVVKESREVELADGETKTLAFDLGR